MLPLGIGIGRCFSLPGVCFQLLENHAREDYEGEKPNENESSKELDHVPKNRDKTQ